MAYVKLDCGMLDSTLWIDRAARELFITALLMAEPYELAEPMEAIEVRSLKNSGFVVPPGWYGFVHAAGTGIIHRSMMEQEIGLVALERLGEPESESRTPDFDGRRMVRVNGGYIILNFDKYRSKDHTAAERSRRYREKKAAESVTSRVTPRSSRVSSRSVTQAEAEAEADKNSTSKKETVAPTAPFRPVKDKEVDKKKCTQSEAEDFAESIGLPRSDGRAMFLHWEEKGWGKVKNWELTIRKWKEFGYLPSQKSKSGQTPWQSAAEFKQAQIDKANREYRAKKEQGIIR